MSKFPQICDRPRTHRIGQKESIPRIPTKSANEKLLNYCNVCACACLCAYTLVCAISGLKLILNVEQHEYVGELSDLAGARVLVHNQTKSPFPEEDGIDVPVGAATSVGLRMVRTSHWTKNSLSVHLRLFPCTSLLNRPKCRVESSNKSDFFTLFLASTHF